MYNFDSVVLYKHDLDSLSPGVWITDSILEFWFEYITSKNAQFGYLGPSVVHWIRDSDQKIPSELLDHKALNSEFLLVPINDYTGYGIGGSHWSLALYIQNEDKWLYYDSMASKTNTILAKGTCQKIYEYIKSQNFLDFAQVEVSQQNNNYDCGLYVILISEILTLNLNLKDLQFDSKSTRRRILDLIHSLAR